MKINYIVLIIGVLFLASCEKPEGTLYSGEANKVSFLGKTINLAMTDGTLEIPIARTSTEGEFTAPVVLSAKGNGYTNVFKIPAPVSFPSGSAKTYVNVTYSNLASIDPSTLSAVGNGLDVTVGLAYPFTLTIGEDAVSDSKVATVDILASNTLSFKDFGTATLDSRNGWWGGDTEEDFLTPKIQKADGVNVYKLITPFGFNNFAFMITSDNKLIVPNQVIYDYGSSSYGPVTMTTNTGTYDPATKKVTINVGAYRVSAGSFGGGVEVIYLP